MAGLRLASFSSSSSQSIHALRSLASYRIADKTSNKRLDVTSSYLVFVYNNRKAYLLNDTITVPRYLPIVISLQCRKDLSVGVHNYIITLRTLIQR